MKSRRKTKNAQINAPGISNKVNAMPAMTACPKATVAFVLMYTLMFRSALLAILSKRADSEGKAAIILLGRDSASRMMKAKNIRTVRRLAVNEAREPMNSVTRRFISSIDITVFKPARSMLYP